VTDRLRQYAEVRWVDSVRTTGWRTLDEALAELDQSDFLDCVSVGILVGETDERLMLAINSQHVTGGLPMVGETIVIPRQSVTAVRLLRAEP
jgi:hypothetical protein